MQGGLVRPTACLCSTDTAPSRVCGGPTPAWPPAIGGPFRRNDSPLADTNQNKAMKCADSALGAEDSHFLARPTGKRLGTNAKMELVPANELAQSNPIHFPNESAEIPRGARCAARARDRIASAY